MLYFAPGKHHIWKDLCSNFFKKKSGPETRNHPPATKNEEKSAVFPVFMLRKIEGKPGFGRETRYKPKMTKKVGP